MSQIPFSYQIRRSKRARKARIVVSAAKVEVVVPLRMAEKQVQRFIHDNRQWVTRTQDKMAVRIQQTVRLAPKQYHHGVLIPFQGRKYPLLVTATARSRIDITWNEVFNAALPEPFLTIDYSDVLREALICWMQRTAALQARKVVTRHAARERLMPRSIRIKELKSRWGSCGIHDDINLNWLLMLAPPEIFEYVVVHELCHLRHRNHSPDFWRLVGEHLPDYHHQRVWLRENGASLMMGL